MTTKYNKHTISIADGSHCACVKDGQGRIKMIAGDIFKDGTHNAIQKAKDWINLQTP